MARTLPNIRPITQCVPLCTADLKFSPCLPTYFLLSVCYGPCTDQSSPSSPFNSNHCYGLCTDQSSPSSPFNSHHCYGLCTDQSSPSSPFNSHHCFYLKQNTMLPRLNDLTNTPRPTRKNKRKPDAVVEAAAEKKTKTGPHPKSLSRNDYKYQWALRYNGLAILRLLHSEQHIGDDLIHKAWVRRRGGSSLTFRQAHQQSGATQQRQILQTMANDLTDAMSGDEIFNLMTIYHQTHGTYNFTTHNNN